MSCAIVTFILSVVDVRKYLQVHGGRTTFSPAHMVFVSVVGPLRPLYKL